MTGKVPQGGMPDPAKTDGPHGDGEADGIMPRDRRGAGGGGNIGAKDAGEKHWHGGDSAPEYHGKSRLGDTELDEDDAD